MTSDSVDPMQVHATPSRPRASGFSGWPALPPLRNGYWTPPTNVFETDLGAIVQIEVAGLGSGSFQVQVERRRLRVEGMRPSSAELSGCVSCRQVEIAGGRFRSDVELPWPVGRDSVEASYRDGFIFVRIQAAGTSEG